MPGAERGGDEKRSFTAWEIEAAKSAGIPVLVLMARETWPGNLYEETDEARAWMREFRRELDRLAVLFDWEEVKVGEREPLPVFRSKVREVLMEHMRKTAPPQAVSSPAARRLPARPPHCFGRDDEVEELVAALLASPPPPVPVLGPGGAGKSTTALTALHDPRVAARYGERRFFVRCDAATGRAALVSEIARTLGIEPGLGRSPAVLVLDNAETPLWGSEMTAIEELLAEAGGCARPGARGDPAGRPAALPPGLASLPWRASTRQDDPDLDPLLEAMDRLAMASANAPATPVDKSLALMTPVDGAQGCATEELSFLNPAPIQQAVAPCGPCSFYPCQGGQIGQICKSDDGRYYTCQYPYEELCTDGKLKCHCWGGDLP